MRQGDSRGAAGIAPRFLALPHRSRAANAGVRLMGWMSWINRTLAGLAGVAIALMMLAGGIDVLLTNLDRIGLQSRPVAGVREFVGTMMVIAVFLAVPLAQQRRNHIQVDLLTRPLPRTWRRVLSALQHLLSAALFAGIAWFAWKTTAHAWAIDEFAAGSVGFPLWPARLCLAFGASVMCLQCVLDFAVQLHPSLDGAAAAPAAH